MKNVMANFFRLFMANKGFLLAVTFVPVVVFLLMNILLPYNEVHSICIINHSQSDTVEKAVRDIEGIVVQDIDEDDISDSLVEGVIELAVIIEQEPVSGMSGVSLITAGESEIEASIELAASSAGDKTGTKSVNVNKAKKHGSKLLTTAPFMMYKFLESGSFFGAMILLDRSRRLKDRILLSGISPVSYYCGMTVVYLILSFVGTLLYFITAMLLDFDTGMRHPVYYLLMTSLVNVLSVSVYFLACSFVNTESGLESAATYPLEILSFVSGLFFPYEYLPKVLRCIGKFSPQRWITHGIEAVQTSGALSAAYRDILIILLFSFMLYGVGLFRLCRKAG